MATAADQQAQAYAERMRAPRPGPDRGLPGRHGEHRRRPRCSRWAACSAAASARRRRILDYAVSATAFPASAHYVALGHLHRTQEIAGPCPIWYSGSPLQVDFGETADRKSVLVVEAHPGRPVEVREHPLTAGRRLRTLGGHARGGAGPRRHHRGRLPPRPPAGGAARGPGRGGAGPLPRLRRRPGAPARPRQVARAPAARTRGRAGGSAVTAASPPALFREYLTATRGDVDEALAGLFAELVEECAP